MVLTIDLSNQAILEVTKGIYKDALAMKSEEVSAVSVIQLFNGREFSILKRLRRTCVNGAMRITSHAVRFSYEWPISSIIFTIRT